MNDEKEIVIDETNKKGSLWNGVTKSFGALSKGITKVGRATGNMVDKTVDAIGESRFIDRQFETASYEYNIVYIEHKFLQATKLRAINNELEKVLYTDFEIKDISKIDCLKDNRQQGFYNLRVLDTKYDFSKQYGDKQVVKKLWQISYSIEQPKQEKHFHITNNDNSITFGKNSTGVIGDNSSATSTKQNNLGLHTHLPKP